MDSMRLPMTPTFLVSAKMRSFVWIFIGLVLLGVSIDPVFDNTDGVLRLKDAEHLMMGEAPNSKYSVVQPLLSLPLYGLGAAFASPERTVAYFNYIVFVGLIATLWWEFREQRERNSVIMLLMAASMFPHDLQRYFGEVLTASACTMGFVLLERRRHALACVLLALGAANTPAALPALTLALLFYVYNTGTLSALIAIALAAALIGGDLLWKFGAIGATPYLNVSERGFKTVLPYSGLPGFSYPFWFGVLSIFFSFGKGLLFFVPGILLRWPGLYPRMPKSQTLLTDTLLVFVLGLVLVYAKWYGWYGGVFWGPRYFLIACVPASILLAYSLSRRLAALPIALLLLSVWVCVQGYLYGLQAIEPCTENQYALEALCWYAPEFSPLWRQFVVGFSRISPARAVYVGWCVASIAYLLFQSFRHSFRAQSSIAASGASLPQFLGSLTPLAGNPEI
jgi:hypothetical protein